MKQQKPEKSFYISNAEKLKVVVCALEKLKPTKEKCYHVRITLDTETRSDKQNKLYYWWLTARAKFQGNNFNEERRQVKLSYGVPILLVEDEEFSNFYMKALNHLSHVEQLEAMDYVPISSIMNVKQMAHYLTDFEMDTAKQGLALEQPKDYYMQALMIQEGATQ